MLISDLISEFIHDTNYEDLPGEVIEKAKHCLLDSIGVALFGSRFEASRISLALIEETGGREEASVLGTNLKAPCFLAALANGIGGHIADYDDSLSEFGGHPSSVLMPVSLALAEMKGLGGRELLPAFVLGVEVGSKLGRIMGMGHYAVGFHPTGTIGTVAASASAAKLLGLSRSEAANALGIAASSAGGLRQNFGTMTKSWHAGRAAAAGLVGALLAQKGYDSSEEALEGDSGFISAFQGSKGAFPAELLGNPYSIMKIQLKRYPSCACTHPAVDAVLKLREEYGFHFKEVREVECVICPLARSILACKKPAGALQAKFSLEYCVAAALITGQLGIDQFSEGAISQPEVNELMERISVEYEPRLEALAKEKNLINPSRVKLVMTDGREVARTVEEARGGPNDPLVWAEVEKKFLECSRQLIPENQALEVVRLIKELERVDSISELTGLLVPTKE